VPRLPSRAFLLERRISYAGLTFNLRLPNAAQRLLFRGNDGALVRLDRAQYRVRPLQCRQERTMGAPGRNIRWICVLLLASICTTAAPGILVADDRRDSGEDLAKSASKNPPAANAAASSPSSASGPASSSSTAAKAASAEPDSSKSALATSMRGTRRATRLKIRRAQLHRVHPRRAPRRNGGRSTRPSRG
jgi:hypothetical protein